MHQHITFQHSLAELLMILSNFPSYFKGPQLPGGSQWCVDRNARNMERAGLGESSTRESCIIFKDILLHFGSGSKTSEVKN